MKPLMTLPCKNRHSDMEKKKGGYHCTSCDHVLTDFRKSSEEEIQATLQSAPGKICGVFHSTQLDYKVSQIQIPAFRAVGLSLLGILGFLGPVVTSCETTTNETAKKQNAFNLLKFPMHVKGTVKDEKTGKPLPFFQVEVLQHGKLVKTAKTDAQGNFDVVIRKDDLTQEVFKLAIGGSNYKKDTLTSNILKFSNNTKVRLTIKAEPTMILEMKGKVACKKPHVSEEHLMQVDGIVIPPTKPFVTAGIPESYYEEESRGKIVTEATETPDTLRYPTLVSQYKPGKTKKIKEKKDAFQLLKFPMNISGTVRDDKTNTVVPHFKVEVLQKGKVIKTALTDEKGNFTIKINREDLKVEKFKLAFGGFNYYEDTISTNLSKFENQKVRLTIHAESIQIPEPSDSPYTITTITSGSVISGTFTPADKETSILEGVAMEEPVTAGIPLPGECEPEN